jgi:membrane-bound lytic murein transglycosylase A
VLGLIRKPEWRAAQCAQQVNANDLGFRASISRPISRRISCSTPTAPDTGLVTGYYEPLLRGSRRRAGPYQTPLYQGRTIC